MAKKQKVAQLSKAPTRKVFWGAVTGIVTAMALNWVVNLASWLPDWLGFLGTPEAVPLITIVVAYGISYFAKEYG